MRILLGVSSTKLLRFQRFQKSLAKLNVECKLVIADDVCPGFPSRRISDWFFNKKKFKRFIKEFGPDVIVSDTARHFTWTAINTNLPVIFIQRGDGWIENMTEEKIYRYNIIKRSVLWFRIRMAEKCYKRVALILPISDYLKTAVDKRYPNKSAVLSHGIEPDTWYPVKGMNLKHPCVGLLQNATGWNKTKEMLVLPKILESMPNVMFYWAGRGDFTDKILSRLDKYDNFEHLGSLQHPDKVREYLTEIDVYALLSGLDMSPSSLREAQVMGKPVVATNIGGVSEIMQDGKTGFLVDEGNAEQYIEKLSVLINDGENRKIMGDTAKKFAESTFSMDYMAAELLKILEKHLNIT